MYYLIKKQQCLLKKAWIIVLASCLGSSIIAQHSPGMWFVQAGAKGDGTTAENPLGSTASLEAVSQPSDLIIVLPSESPLDGGIALKNGQTLIGLSDVDPKPRITNTSPERNGGNGLVLAGDNRIGNIRIENPFASGIMGTNVSGCWIEEVEIVHANQSRTSLDIKYGLGEVHHGGITLLHPDSIVSSTNHISNTRIIDATGPGIASVSFNGVKNLLRVHNCRVQGGSFVAPPVDCGILSAAEGENTKSMLEVSDSKISGRMSPHGRNIVIAANAKASAKARIARTYSGKVGQDGILGVVMVRPAEVIIDIENSILEKATTNLEGTIVNVPTTDSLRASDAKVSIHVKESMIRDAIANMEWEGEKVRAGNIIMGPSPRTPTPMPAGSYELSIMNSRVENGEGYGFYIGILSEEFQCEPELLGRYKVILRDNVITNNGESELILSGANVKIDARQNCWGSSGELENTKVLIGDHSDLSQLDTSDPIPCLNEN